MIRPITTADADAYIRLRREMIKDSPFSFGSSPDEDRASSIEFVHAAVADPTATIFGAFEPDLVGAVRIYRDRTQKGAHHAHIWGVYVRPSHRGRGLGRPLMKAAIDFARDLPGVTDVHLAVSDRATIAAELYRSLGFVTWGIEPSALRIDGVDAAEHHMVLMLKRVT
jgi:ribosomal protein S18 acetylase RimI-like enzyme